MFHFPFSSLSGPICRPDFVENCKAVDKIVEGIEEKKLSKVDADQIKRQVVEVIKSSGTPRN